MSGWTGDVTELFGYVKEAYGNVAPSSAKPFLDSFIDQIKQDNGPVIRLHETTYEDPVLGTTGTGYQIEYDGTIYTSGDDLINAASQTEYFSNDVYYGSLGPEPEDSNESRMGPNTLYQYIYNSVNPSVVTTGVTGMIPGTGGAYLTASRNGDNGIPSLVLNVAGDSINIVPSYDELYPSHTADMNEYKYINYQIIKSSSADVLLKFYRAKSPLADRVDHSNVFESKSINHYITANESGRAEYYPPKVHPQVASLDGGFALAQYDTASSGNISLTSPYNYGILFMNPSAAPLIYITNKTTSITRSATTSLYTLGGGTLTPGGEGSAVNGEILFGPSSDSGLSDEIVSFAPLFSPASKDMVSQHSGWLCIGKASRYSSIGKIQFGNAIYRNDHGFLLNGGYGYGG